MSPTKFRLKRQKSTPKRQKSPRTPKQKTFQSPVTPRRITVASSGNSPQFPWQSQEVHDGVTWDYRSPMQQKLRSARKHGKAAVTELLTCINHEAEKQERTSLLDTWISAEPRMVSPVQCCTRASLESWRRRTSHPRHLAKELQELSEAINEKDDSKEDEETRLLHSPHLGKNGTLNSDTANKFHAANSIDLLDSSSEELWGADNDSFLIQATQATEQAEDEYVNAQPRCATKMLVADVNKEFIPPKDEAICRGTKAVASYVSNGNWHKENQNPKDLYPAESSDSNKNVISHVDVAENFWESDNSFDEILSSIPYDELAEENSTAISINNSNLNKNPAIQTANYHSSKSVNNVSENKLKRRHQDKFIHERNKTDNKTRCLIISNKNSSLFTAVSSMNLQADSIDWESDEFDAVVMQAEILMTLEQAESQALGSQKCTPEEIARKKAEALKRRKHKNVNAQTVMQKTRKPEMIWKDRLRSKAIKKL